VFVNSINRNVYKYPNSADFVLEGNQTETWNLIRSTSRELPLQRSQNEYYNVKVACATLPYVPELLQEPGIFLTFDIDHNQKSSKNIHHLVRQDLSGFKKSVDTRTVAEIASEYGVTEAELTTEQLQMARKHDADKFHSTNKLTRATFYLVCDKVQFDGEGSPAWVQYKCYMDQVLPLNLRGNSVAFILTDVYGQKIKLSSEPSGVTPAEKDLWRDDMGHPNYEGGPSDHRRQVNILFEFTHVKNERFIGFPRELSNHCPNVYSASAGQGQFIPSNTAGNAQFIPSRTSDREHFQNK